MGCCLSKETIEKQVVYMPLPHKQHALSTILEATHESESIEIEPLHI